MPRSDDGELLNEQDLAELESKLEQLGREKSQCEHKIKELRHTEDPEREVFFAQEIFARQQEKLRLQVEMDLGRAKKNRFLLAREWGEV
ncbi:MAG: hypothetical protein R6U55_00365 [Desulfovermiculus sp.]